MILARWRVERRAKRDRAAVKAKYHQLIEAARKAKDRNQLAEVENDYYNSSIEIDEDEVFRTDWLIRRAQRLDLPVPQQLEPFSPQWKDDDNWNFNQMTGNYTLTDKARRELTSEIRKEETDRLHHKVRWVTSIIIPIMSLLIAIGSLILAFFRNK